MTDLLLVTDSVLILQQAVGEILMLNEKTAEYGLTLTEKQAEALAVSRQENLRSSGRIEFGGGIIRRLAEAFCDSPYVNRQNWEETLHGLLELFYSFKNETWDAVSDGDLIAFMRQAFNGTCGGSLELLADRELPAFSEQIHKGGKP